MYNKFYNIITAPFSTLPSPSIFYDSRNHQEAWEYLIKGISYQEPFLLVTGDQGTGKTLLCLKLIQELQQKKTCPCVYIPAPSDSYAFLLYEIAGQLDISLAGSDEAAIQQTIFKHLKYLSRDTFIYIILDDVQEIDLSTLKKLLLLANFNYHEVFPVKFALFAHDSFIDQLTLPALTILKYKLKQSFHLSCLDLHETKEYIYFRLIKAEAPGIPAFTEDAIKEIYAYSNGIPQLINKICDACLVHGAAQKSKLIEAPLVVDAKKAIDIGYSEKKAESKVVLVPDSQIPAPSTDAYHTETGVTEGNANKNVLNTIRNLAAILIFAFITLFSALILINYFQYRAITSLKNISFKDKYLIPQETTKESFEVSTITIPEDKSLINKKTGGHESSSMVPLPDTGSIKNTSEELTTSVPEGENGAIPYEQQITSIYSEQKADEASTTILETATSTLPAKTARYPYTIQLACYNSLEGAKERMVLFKESGLSPYLARSVSRQTEVLYWVIYTGHYKTLEEAEQVKQKHNLNYAIVTKTPYAILVGVYSKPDEMTGIINRIESAGQFPYVIEETDNVYRLYVGAFTTKQGAENLHEQLKAAGINSVIEER